MKFTYEQPEPLRYEYRIVEISTGKVLCTYRVSEGETVTRAILPGGHGPCRLEKHSVEPEPQRAGLSK